MPARAGSSCTGTRLAPAQQAPTRMPSSNTPMILAPPLVGAAVPVAPRWASMKTLLTGSRCASSLRTPLSAPSRVRTEIPAGQEPSLRDANHGATLDSIFAIGLPHLFSDTHGLFDQCLNNLALGHSLDDFTLHKDLALAVAGSNAKISLTGLTGTIHHAAHNGHPQRNLHAFKAGSDLLGKCVHVHLGAAA